MEQSQDKLQPRLRKKYNDVIHNFLSERLKIENKMRIPKISKIVINMGIGAARENSKWLTSGVDELTLITGQKAVITHAKKAISNFKIREGDPVGARVTLRANKMYEFLDRFISVASPRIRDFRGLSEKSFDGRGNYNFGIDEQIIFPEIDYDKIDKIRGLNITICTTAKNDKEGLELLKGFNMPFPKNMTN